ncbi:MAG: STAS domain-containing protein [Thermoleophilaceae bacterium]
MTILDFETREEAEQTLIELRGELDLSTTEKVERELTRVEAQAPSVLVLDLSGLKFLDSTGLRLVVGADQRARAADRRLVVVKGPAAVHRVFSITKLDERLEMVDEA